MKSPCSYRTGLWIIVLFLSGCASVPPRVTTRAVAPCPCERPHALVLVADGAGDFRAASTALAEVAEQQHAALCVQSFVWSHGYGRILADELGYKHMGAEGKLLAALILAHKQAHPETPIFLVSHSAGAGVVLIAAELLPPDSVERIILLAPAVSTHRDLRGPLAAARQGVDVFYSEADRWYLGMAVALLGTADRRWDTAAGRYGFQPTLCAPADGLLYEKLRQYPWEKALSWTGNNGGHYGTYQPGFLKACVLPLLENPKSEINPYARIDR